MGRILSKIAAIKAAPRGFTLNGREEDCNPKIKSIVLDGSVEKFLRNV